METFHQVIEIAPRNDPRYQRVITIAGTDTAYTVLASTILEMVGVNPEWHGPVAIPGHPRQNLPMAKVRIRSETKSAHSVRFWQIRPGTGAEKPHSCGIRSKGRLGHAVISFGRPVPV